MYQVSGKAPSKTTTLVLLAAIVIVALSYLAMQIVVRSGSDNTAISLEVPQSGVVFADASTMQARWIERHMNPLFDAPADPQLIEDIQTANALRDHWTTQHLSPVFAGDGESASSDAMTAHWIERHMNPVFDR